MIEAARRATTIKEQPTLQDLAQKSFSSLTSQIQNDKINESKRHTDPTKILSNILASFYVVLFYYWNWILERLIIFCII